MSGWCWPSMSARKFRAFISGWPAGVAWNATVRSTWGQNRRTRRYCSISSAWLSSSGGRASVPTRATASASGLFGDAGEDGRAELGIATGVVEQDRARFAELQGGGIQVVDRAESFLFGR